MSEIFKQQPPNLKKDAESIENFALARKILADIIGYSGVEQANVIPRPIDELSTHGTTLPSAEKTLFNRDSSGGDS